VCAGLVVAALAMPAYADHGLRAWAARCKAYVGAAQRQVAKKLPAIAAGRIRVQRRPVDGTEVRFSYSGPDDVPSFRAAVSRGGHETPQPWHDPGVCDSSPDLNLERETKDGSAYIQVYSHLKLDEDEDEVLTSFSSVFRAALDHCLDEDL
jgi:hypothetical protein